VKGRGGEGRGGEGQAPKYFGLERSLTGATENAGFKAKVQRSLGLDFVTEQHRSLQTLQPVCS